MFNCVPSVFSFDVYRPRHLDRLHIQHVRADFCLLLVWKSSYAQGNYGHYKETCLNRKCYYDKTRALQDLRKHTFFLFLSFIPIIFVCTEYWIERSGVSLGLDIYDNQRTKGSINDYEA